MFDLLTDTTSNTYIEDYSKKIAGLANYALYQQAIPISEEITLQVIGYRLLCESRALLINDNHEASKAEMNHRYFKALKLAGAYAFAEQSGEITEELLHNAIKLTEESGEAFTQIMKRERSYVKLARYIANTEEEVTHADMTEDLPFYTGSEPNKRTMLSLAVAWGYKNNVIITQTNNDGIEFFTGESLKETDLSEMILAHSIDIATGYINELVSFDQLHLLIDLPGRHFINHHLKRNT